MDIQARVKYNADCLFFMYTAIPHTMRVSGNSSPMICAVNDAHAFNPTILIDRWMMMIASKNLQTAYSGGDISRSLQNLLVIINPAMEAILKYTCGYWFRKIRNEVPNR